MTFWLEDVPPPETATVPEMNTPLAWLPEMVFPAPVVIPPTVTWLDSLMKMPSDALPRSDVGLPGMLKPCASVPIALPAIRTAEELEHIDSVGEIAGDHVSQTGCARRP